MRGFIFTLLCLVLTCGFSGCATFNPYQQVDQSIISQSAVCDCGDVEIQRGKPRPIIDAAGRFLGIPNQIALGDKRVDNHNVSQATELEITNYLEQNGLNSVLVRSNQYAPVDELKRTISNDKIRPFWKLTFGSYNFLKYTLLPGRLTGGDWYNPYSDSLHIYSDSPILAVSKATYASDVRSRVNPGAYVAIKDIPLLGLGHDTTSTKLAIRWYETSSPEKYQEAKEVLYPNYGASVGGQIASFVPYGGVFGRILGGGVGRVASKLKTR